MENYDEIEIISNHIMTLQEHGLEMNEHAANYEYVPIELYISLLDGYINTLTFYRNEVERSEQYKTHVNEIYGIFGLKDKLK